MNCIILTDESVTQNAIRKMISKAENVIYLASFDNSTDASEFMAGNNVDVVFLDIQIFDPKVFDFAITIPEKTFVIYVSRYYKFETPDCFNNLFQISLREAQRYSESENKKPKQILNDYFII